MIAESKILEFITQWKATSSISILRADQMAKKPVYPYATYKEIISNEENSRSNIIESEYDGLNETVKIKTNETSETTISVNLFSASHAEAKTKTEILRYALKTKAVNLKAKELNFTILSGLMAVQDRTIVLEGVIYEYCFGFDFIIRATNAHEEVIETIETVTGTITSKDVSGEIIQESEYEVSA